MEICIGIISYFPDGPIRQARIDKLNKLLVQCDKLFGLPIIIIAQNWHDIDLPQLNRSDVYLLYYKNAIGITGARRALRKYFINSKFDYLIMLDDDCAIGGSPESAEKYLTQIRQHPNMYGIFKSMLLKLFAISKEVYKMIDFPIGEPQKGDFFEDMWLIMALSKLYPKQKFVFNKAGLTEYSNSSSDINSTWYHKQLNKHKMGDKTRAMIGDL